MNLRTRRLWPRAPHYSLKPISTALNATGTIASPCLWGNEIAAADGTVTTTVKGLSAGSYYCMYTTPSPPGDGDAAVQCFSPMPCMKAKPFDQQPLPDAPDTSPANTTSCTGAAADAKAKSLAASAYWTEVNAWSVTQAADQEAYVLAYNAARTLAATKASGVGTTLVTACGATGNAPGACSAMTGDTTYSVAALAAWNTRCTAWNSAEYTAQFAAYAATRARAIARALAISNSMAAVMTVANTRATTPGPAALDTAAADAADAAAAAAAEIKANVAAEAKAEAAFQAHAAWRWATYDHIDVNAWRAVVAFKTAAQGVHDVADILTTKISTKMVADLATEVTKVSANIAAFNVAVTAQSLITRDEVTALSTTANTNAVNVRTACYGVSGANQKAVTSSGPCVKP